MNIFERAIRRKLRFGNYNGLIGAEDLFDLTLPQLNEVAKRHHNELQSATEISFIDEVSAEDIEAKLRMDVIKHVIASKMADKVRGEKAAETNAKRARIKELMAKKRDEEDSELSFEELEEQYNALGGDETEV